MNKISNSNIDLIQCPYCRNNAKKTLIDKIKNSICALTSVNKYSIKSLYYHISWFKLGKSYIENYKEMDCPNEEHALIIINNKRFTGNNFVFGSGIDLLVDYFIANSIKFKIYDCHDSESFYKSIEKTKAQNLWIFGHGDRHGISFGKEKGDYCPFCKVVGSNRRSFIAQLHCCHKTGKTLWEYLSDKPGIFSEGFREPAQNREDISKWIRDNKINSKKSQF
jgi:hypothetical protein